MSNFAPEQENEFKHEPLIKKDKSLLYMIIILGLIISVMAYLTLFVDDPWKMFEEKESAPVTATAEKQELLEETSEMTDEEVKKSLVKFIEAFYYDQQRGYFDPPSYFAPITETFFNYHKLGYRQIRELYMKRKEDMENLERNWIVSSLDFERADSRIVASYWAKERYFRPSSSEQISRSVKYEMIIDEDGKIVSYKEAELRNVEKVKVERDSTTTSDLPGGAAAATIGQIYDFSVVDEKPEFPGGQREWAKFLATHLSYPPQAKENKVQGKVMVAFIVAKDGSLRDIKVRQGIGSGCDEEAVRLIKSSSPWKPGMVNGNVVSTYCVFPVNFQLP